MSSDILLDNKLEFNSYALGTITGDFMNVLHL